MSASPDEDVLSSVLAAYQLRAGIYGNPRFCGSWQFGMSGHRRAAFHVVGEGDCWLHMKPDGSPVPLHAGDMVVFPHDAWHLLSAGPERNGEENRMPDDQGGAATTLVCGYFEFLAGDKNPILDALPELIIIRGNESGRSLAALSGLLFDEIAAKSLGTRTVIDKLADTLFVMMVRQYVNQRADKRGLLAGLADPRLGKALAAMHREMAKGWTLESLGQVAGMSRATFSQRFAEMVGTTPIEYLTRWRMTQAELLLRDPKISVASVAERVGYDTEAAFRKAFKRVHGVGPGSIRRWFRDKLVGS